MDIGASNWAESDSSNTTAAPDGAPEGMAPSGINDVLRAHQGAEKRFWNRINPVKTTGGTSTAYTLAYDVAAAAYYDGEIISFIVNATNGASATLNVNALGAIPLRLFGAALMAGALATGQIVQARYGSAAGAFDIIPQDGGWVRLASQSPSAASSVDFTGIPAGVNNIHMVAEVRPSTDGANINMRTYGAAGVVAFGASDYTWWNRSNNTTPSGGDNVATTTLIQLASSADNGTFGVSVEAKAFNIQAATSTKFHTQSNYLDSAGVNGIGLIGYASRNEADRITGITLFPSVGTFTGKATLFAST